MPDAAYLLSLVGGLFLVSVFVDALARRLRIPRVTLLIASGILLGPHLLGLIDEDAGPGFALIADVTLLIIGYLLGARLTRSFIARYARDVSLTAIVITAATALCVALGLMALGFSAELSWILGAIAAATDPAATLDVLKQQRNRRHFDRILEGVVALDDVLGLLLFSLVLGGLQILNGNGDPGPHLMHVVQDIGGALIIGSSMGWIVAWLLNRLPAGKPVIVESLAFIFLCGGIAMLCDVGVLLASMTMGAVMVNRVKPGSDHLHEIEFIEEPFLVIFFIMAGSTLDFGELAAVGSLGIAFIALRVLGRYLGGLLVPGQRLTRMQKQWLGLALLPQAGIAMGMALVASQQYPELAHQILPVAITATVVFELFGPLMTNLAIQRQRPSTDLKPPPSTG